MNVQVLIIIVYFAATVAIGLWSSKRTKSANAFTGTALTIFSIVCASTGEWLGGTATTGVSEYGFNFGMSGAWYTISNGIGVMFLGLCFAKLFRSLETGTVPGIIEHYFGLKTRIVSCVVLTIVMLAVGLSQMIAAGKLGQNLLGIDFTWACAGFAAIFIVYTLAGGMNAVASTNVLHLFVMYFGMILAVILTIVKIGGFGAFRSGIALVESSLAAEGRNVSFWNMFSIGGSKVSSWIIASLLGACTAQAGLQPVLAAKSVNDAKKACVITAFVAAPFGFFSAFLGMGARVLSQRGELFTRAGTLVTNGKDALPALMMNMNPLAGGLVLSAILAAVLSTVSPIILAAGTMVTRDIYQQGINPGASDEQVLKMSRITTALSGVVCCIGAIFLVNATAVLDIVYAAYSLRGACFVVVLLGMYWKLVSEKGAITSLIVTAVVAILWVVMKMTNGSYPVAPWFSETYAAVVAAFVSCVVFSLFFPKRT